MSDPHKHYNMPRADGEPPRWTATIWYRTDVGERGPNFYAIDHIEVRHTRNPTPDLTIEAALAQWDKQ